MWHTCQVGRSGDADSRDLTVDELAAAAGTTTRRVRSLQTLGLLPHPELRGRTGVYRERHLEQLTAIGRLQERGFSLESLGVLFAALDAGKTLAAVLGVTEPAAAGAGGGAGHEAPADTAELYGFCELQPAAAGRRTRQPLLSLVPTTVWEESEAS
jgi:DNA-binding transcriptional MerR regulator